MEPSQSEKNRDHTNSNGVTSLSVSIDHEDLHHADNTNFNVTVVLSYCKTKILKPYQHFLCVMGLRPIYTDQINDNCSCLEFFSYLYTMIIICLLILGYILQFMACFKRDRGFAINCNNNIVESNGDVREANLYDTICNGSTIFSYIIPNALHLIAYFYAVLVFRTSDDDQLTSLMERVFLFTSNLRDGMIIQRKLVRTLWIFVVACITWMCVSLVSVTLMLLEDTVNFKWIDISNDNINNGLKLGLILATLSHDAVQATIISNYCLQAQLLTSYLNSLKEKLIQNPLQPSEWMRDINEFKKLLVYFNKELSPSVALLTIVNISWSISGIFWLLNYDHADHEHNLKYVSVAALNLLLWITISIAPFIQASRLTCSCKSVQSIGHEIRIRPFVYQATPGYKLDTLLLYASSLKMTAKLFNIPIHCKYICTFFTLIVITLLILGQLHYF